MTDKKLVVFYYYTDSNKKIAEEDFKAFYSVMEENEAFEKEGIIIENYFAPDAAKLLSKLTSLLAEPYSELYLHFSGHGRTEGIPYDDWVLKSSSFSIMLDHPKVKFCFFSSCKSAQLVKIVSERKIPIVIGTEGDDNIENGYAIEFQKKFYSKLSKKLSFLKAFEQAQNDLKVEQKIEIKVGVLTRAEMALDDLEATVNNKLQIVFSEDEEKNRHLVYPTVVEAITNVEENKQIIFAYADNKNLLDEFEASFNKKGLHEQSKLFLLNENDLRKLDDNDGKGVFLEDIKILFIVQSARDIFENEKLVNVFDDQKKFTEFDNLKFALAIKNGTNENNLFKNTSYFKEEIDKYTGTNKSRFYYDTFDDLFDDNGFDRYINEIGIHLSTRKSYIINNLSHPTKKEVKFIKDPMHYLRVLFAHKKNEKLINYIINWLSGYEKFETPIIISDYLHKDQLTAIDALKAAIKSTYKDDPTYTLFLEQNMSFALAPIILHGHIIVIRTDLDDLEELKTQVREVLLAFDQVPNLSVPPKSPTYIFFINEDSFSFSEADRLSLAKTKNFSKPSPISKEFIELWTSFFQDSNKEFDEIIEKLLQIDFDKYKDQCPSGVIEEICDHFKIPRKQILSIS